MLHRGGSDRGDSMKSSALNAWTTAAACNNCSRCGMMAWHGGHHYRFEVAHPLISMTTRTLVLCVPSNIVTITVLTFTTFVRSFECLSSTPLAVGCSQQGGAYAWTPVADR